MNSTGLIRRQSDTLEQSLAVKVISEAGTNPILQSFNNGRENSKAKFWNNLTLLKSSLILLSLQKEKVTTMCFDISPVGILFLSNKTWKSLHFKSEAHTAPTNSA